MRKNKFIFPAFLASFVMLFGAFGTFAQSTFPVNGLSNPQDNTYAFINATIVKDASQKITHATMIIHDKKIVAVGTQITIPGDAIVIDCKGKYIYPSFIDLYSEYGIAAPQRNTGRRNPFSGYQFTSTTPGAFAWNQALRPEVNGADLFHADNEAAETWRNAGFGTVLTHQHDGIARGTGTLVTLANQTDNLVMLKEKASAQYSFSKGSSTQSYPSSLMGVIALLRQSYLDAAWYKSLPPEEGKNLSLEAWNQEQDLPQIFEANDKWNCLRASRIGNEFGVKYILKAGGNEYQRIKEMAATGSSFILPLNFPEAMDVSDPNTARYVSLADMENWEQAPGNPAAFEKAHIPFCLTADGLKDAKSFMANLRKAIDAGLSEKTALEALTRNPATLLNVYDMTGSLEAGKLANFIITSAPVFDEKSVILQNWIQGEKYGINESEWNPVSATYDLTITSSGGVTRNYTLNVKSLRSASVISTDTLSTQFSFDGKLVQIVFSPAVSPKRRKDIKKEMPAADTATGKKMNRPAGQNLDSLAKAQDTGDDQKADTRRPQRFARPGGERSLPGGLPGPTIRLSGVSNGDNWQGNGLDTSGTLLYWTATLARENTPKEDTSKEKKETAKGTIDYPFGAYGWETMPTQHDLLIKNAIVWTSDKEGILKNTDVLVRNGKIAAIGKNLSAPSATVIDGTGKQLTPGIIDEHSHIATASINEGGQSVTSEVRIADNLNPDDINIYRELSGGVTTAHILHGSANTIGGQTQLIKLRWGVNDTALKFAGAAPFIKFALGENVKNTRSSNNNRFPNTRMGVEEVLMDAFTRARDYEHAIQLYNNRPRNSTMAPVRRDLELDALVEIMNKKRFITCHSYKQSEILASMKVADKFGFRYNTFTHVLEGYKLADKLKEHGANVSTFSDWFNYKTEVVDAIPQNANIMYRAGLNVAINSDDAEMARRLNQEAAKSVRYGGMTEEDALKMVTINPAIMLHVENRTGSIKVGKDADLVLWTDDPLSIYAIADITMVDGMVYYSRERDQMLRKRISEERNRLIQKMNGEKKSGAPTMRARTSDQVLTGFDEGDDGGENDQSGSN